MSAEFFGKELTASTVVTPLIAAPELCFYECTGMDDEHNLACRDAVLEPGSVQIVGCTGYDPDLCGASRHHVGDISDSGEFEPHSGYQIDRRVNLQIAKGLGINPMMIQNESDRVSGLENLSQALTLFELRLLER